MKIKKLIFGSFLSLFFINIAYCPNLKHEFISNLVETILNDYLMMERLYCDARDYYKLNEEILLKVRNITNREDWSLSIRIMMIQDIINAELSA